MYETCFGCAVYYNFTREPWRKLCFYQTRFAEDTEIIQRSHSVFIKFVAEFPCSIVICMNICYHIS